MMPAVVHTTRAWYIVLPSVKQPASNICIHGNKNVQRNVRAVATRSAKSNICMQFELLIVTPETAVASGSLNTTEAVVNS